DDITSLHQLTPQTKPTETRLFKPRDGYRTRVPNLGPNIDYFLPRAPTGAVVVEILDGKGQVVNSYNSETPAPRAGRGGDQSQLEDPDAAPAGRRVTPPPRVTKNAGFNRFVWDLR